VGSVEVVRELIDETSVDLSVRRQRELLGLSRSTFYYESATETEANRCLMRLIDEQYLATPFYGSRRMAVWLMHAGHSVNRKRVKRLMRLMRLMGLEAIYPKPRLSDPNKEHRKVPYLLRGLSVNRVNQVWATDITYVPMSGGFMYLAGVIDWHSRCVLSWRLSNSLEGSFCVDALEAALELGSPEIFNTDQGSQFTSRSFTGCLERAGVSISMDGRCRAVDNVFVERLWWSVKYEHVYRHDHQTVASLHQGLKAYLEFFNRKRRHQSLEYETPWDVYRGSGSATVRLRSPPRSRCPQFQERTTGSCQSL
jgi:putative transposase